MVLDADDYTVVGKIEGLSRCQVARDLGIAFIKDGDGRPVAAVQEVVVLELKTLKVTGRVKTGQADTDAIIYEPVTKHIFTFNGDSHNTPVIDAAKESACERRDAALAVLSIAVYFTGGPINHQVRVMRGISRQTIHRFQWSLILRSGTMEALGVLSLAALVKFWNTVLITPRFTATLLALASDVLL